MTDSLFSVAPSLDPKKRLRDRYGYSLPFPNKEEIQNDYTRFVCEEDGEHKKNAKIIIGPTNDAENRIGLLELFKLLKYLYQDRNEITAGIYGSGEVRSGKYDGVVHYLMGAIATGKECLEGSFLETIWNDLVGKRKKTQFGKISRFTVAENGGKYLTMDMMIPGGGTAGFSLLGLMVFSSMLCSRRKAEISANHEDHVQKYIANLCVKNMNMAIESCRIANSRNSLPLESEEKMYAYDSNQKIFPNDAVEYLIMRGYLSPDCRKNLRVRLLEKSAFKNSSNEYECNLIERTTDRYPWSQILSIYGISKKENVLTFKNDNGSQIEVLYSNMCSLSTTPQSAFDFNAVNTTETIVEYTVQIRCKRTRKRVELVCTLKKGTFDFLGVSNDDKNDKKRVYTFELDSKTSELVLKSEPDPEWDTSTVIYWPSKSVLSVTTEGSTVQVVGVPDPYRTLNSKTMHRPLSSRLRYMIFINGFDDSDLHDDPLFVNHPVLKSVKTLKTTRDPGSIGAKYLMIVNTEFTSRVTIKENGSEVYDKKIEISVKNKSGRSESLFGLYKRFRVRFRGETWEDWKKETDGKPWNET